MKITQSTWKFVIIGLFFLFAAQEGFSQNVGISSSSGFTPDASAALDISFTNRGLLVPRVALTANNVGGPIASPATSLLVYNTATAGSAPFSVVPGYYYWNGSAWTLLTSSAQAGNFWSTTGNAGTSYPTNYLGTTDNFGLHVKTNNAHRFWIDSLGSVAVGTNPIFSSAAREKFLVDAGTTGSYNVISGKGNLNSYLQLNIQNLNAGTGASSDVVATADDGNESTYYIDMGTNSSANTANVFGGAHDSYLYSTGGSTSSASGGNLYIGTITAGKSLGFLTGGSTIGTPASGSTAAAANNERLHIDGTTGFVGLNNPSPSQVLDVTGNMRFSGALMPNNDPGTAGYFLQSTGSGTAPTWINASNYINSLSWSTTGNSGTTAGTNFIGTTDAVDFVAKTSNAERLRINSTGNVSIGGTALNGTNPEQLLVDAGTTSSYNVISGKGNLNNYLQLNIQNTNNGTAASSDVVASNSTATETTNYIDMGINSSNYTSAASNILSGPNTAYLYATGNDFVIGNGTASKSVTFFTSGTNSTATYAERMRIDPSGNVGIGTAAPTQKLDVNGSINATGSVYVDGASSNTGTISPGLIFGGSGSGETISSKRTSGTNQYGIDFYTSSNLRMSVANGGNVGIGTNTPANKLTVAGIISPSTDNNSAYTLGTSALRWSVVYATNGAIQTSDRRLKTNIKDLKYGLKEVLALQPVSYNWKDKAQPQNKIGLIAQDVKKLVPEVVSGNEAKEKLGINYAELVPVLINAIKEQQHRLNKQQKEIEDLKKTIRKRQLPTLGLNPHFN